MNNAPQHPQDTEQQVDRNKRRLTKAALGSSALIVTLASRPAIGCVAQTASGFQSGNTSPGAGSLPQPCAGRSPGYWGEKNSYGMDSEHPAGDWALAGRFPGVCKNSTDCNKYTNWTDERDQHGYVIRRATRFADEFSTVGNFKAFADKDLSLMQIIHLSGREDPYQMGAHLSAALLNAASGKNPLPTVEQVMAIAYQFDRQGYYEPTAGVQWYAQDIKAYLTSTWD